MSAERLLIPACILVLALGACPGEEEGGAAAVDLPRLSSDVAFGGRDLSLDTLAAAGVRTVVVVESRAPDVAAAERLGLRAVHLPFGHAGIPKTVGLRIAKLVRELPGPFFFRGTGGESRAVAAAALAEMTLSGLTPPEAVAKLRQAGLSPEHHALFRSVERFRLPSVEETRAHSYDFAAPGEVSPFAVAMSRLSTHVANLRASRAAVWTSPPDRPELHPPAEALKALEQLIHALDTEEAKGRPDRFRELLVHAQAAVQEVEVRLSEHPPDPDLIEPPWVRLRTSCKECHAEFRSPPRAD